MRGLLFSGSVPFGAGNGVLVAAADREHAGHREPDGAATDTLLPHEQSTLSRPRPRHGGCAGMSLGSRHAHHGAASGPQHDEPRGSRSRRFLAAHRDRHQRHVNGDSTRWEQLYSHVITFVVVTVSNVSPAEIAALVATSMRRSVTRSAMSTERSSRLRSSSLPRECDETAAASRDVSAARVIARFGPRLAPRTREHPLRSPRFPRIVGAGCRGRVASGALALRESR